MRTLSNSVINLMRSNLIKSQVGYHKRSCLVFCSSLNSKTILDYSCHHGKSNHLVKSIHQTAFSLSSNDSGNKGSPIRSRRRRRNQHDRVNNDPDVDTQNEGGSPLIPTAVKDPDIFYIEADLFLDKIEKALEPMKLCNDFFLVERNIDDNNEALKEKSSTLYLCIRLHPSQGVYTLQGDENQFTISLNSPVSGGHTYVLSYDECEYKWVGEDDGHSLEGLLVRDLIRQCQGVPQL